MKATLDCPSCKGHHTLRCVASVQEIRRSGMIARCCYSCGFTNQNRLPPGQRKYNDSLAGKLVTRAQQFGRQVRNHEIGYRDGVWFPLSKAQSDARRAEQALVTSTINSRRDRVAGAVPGGVDEAVGRLSTRETVESEKENPGAYTPNGERQPFTPRFEE